MPGKVGVKLIPRKSTSGKYHSLKELVFKLLDASNGTCTKESVEKVVKKEYQKSNFLSTEGRGGHFTWYKHRWNKAKLEGANFTLKEKVSEEDGNERVRHEGKKGKAKRTKSMESDGMVKRPDRRKGRRVPVQPKKRSVAVKARKKPVQRKGDPKVPGQPQEDQPIHD